MVCLRHSFFIAEKSNHSTSYAANFGSWYFIFVFSRWLLLPNTSILFMLEAVDKTDNDFDTADNDNNFGSWYFIFVFARWSSLSNTSLFLMFKVVDKTDNNFDTADNDDGNDNKTNPFVNAYLPAIAFLSGGLFFFVVVAMNNEVLFIQPEK